MISTLPCLAKLFVSFSQLLSNVRFPLSLTQRDRSLPGNSCRPIKANIEIKNKVRIRTSVIIFIDFISVFTMAFKPEIIKMIMQIKKCYQK